MWFTLVRNVLLYKNRNLNFKYWCKNEFQDNNEKSCSWFRNRVPQKIDFRADEPHESHPPAWELMEKISKFWRSSKLFGSKRLKLEFISSLFFNIGRKCFANVMFTLGMTVIQGSNLGLEKLSHVSPRDASKIQGQNLRCRSLWIFRIN